ncbi:hypothetical protein [Haloarchaeobius amylolyticus]|uniref:hypothetical protein n=1 Tax=Haloarchaeobius amylolyticus TaxID=1198296 RepID=UPI002270922C|nr:hypothetical protein [Haloarchaeobius amylolyticus]
MAAGPPSAPDGASMIPLPARLVGGATMALVVVALVSYAIYLGIVGKGANAAVLQVCLGTFGLGVVLVLWDELTDFFDESRP